MDDGFLRLWHEAANITLGLFWTAFWAFGLGYLISSAIQVFVTRQRMRESMGETGARSVGLGSFFGFISSSCSFAALATTRSLFSKGAGLIPSLAFLLASTNLVIELGIVIAVFLSWQFVVAEYVGAVLLVLFMWLAVRLTYPATLVERARARLSDGEGHGHDSDAGGNWKQHILSAAGWQRVANRYVMEWKMVWKDVTVGFTVAGVIAAFVPASFFQSLFIGSGSENPSFWAVVAQAVIGPVAAFFTFIGSMGNIPLAAVLYGNGVAFAGIIAFMFSDLVVFPVLRIQAKYYGWKLALYIMAVFLAVLVVASVVVHYGFVAAGLLPAAAAAHSVVHREFFAVDYTMVLNLAFAVMSVVFVVWKAVTSGFDFGRSDDIIERVLFWLALAAAVWLAGGISLPLWH